MKLSQLPTAQDYSTQSQLPKIGRATASTNADPFLNSKKFHLNPDQHKILHDLHEIQQRQLEDLLRRQQEQQMQLLAQWMVKDDEES